MGGVEWSTAERNVMERCKVDGYALFRSARPVVATDENRVRAGLVRFLLLGGDGQQILPHPRGVRIEGAWITGQLNFDSCVTTLELGLLKCKFEAAPTMIDARIGALCLNGSAMPGLNLHRIKVAAGVYLESGFHSDGPVDLVSARITGRLSCSDGRIVVQQGRALNCDAAHIGTDVFLRDNFHATGEVNFAFAQIGAQLDCQAGHFMAQNGRALNCEAANIGNGVRLCNGFLAEREVNFRGARITGQIDCNAGEFLVPNGRSLNFNAAHIDANVSLVNGFLAYGEVNFAGSIITGALFCARGKIIVKDGSALNCEAAQIGKDVFLHNGFETNGHIEFRRAEVAGNIDFADGRFDGRFSGQGMRVNGGLFWLRVRGQRPAVDLTQAHVDVLHDDMESWAGVKDLHLSGFVYDRLNNLHSVKQRLDWLAKSPEDHHQSTPYGRGHRPNGFAGFDPKPYTQLACVLKIDGHRSAAARVLETREDRLRKAEYDAALAGLSPDKWAMQRVLRARFRRGWDWVFKGLFGYGLAPSRSLLWALGIWLFTFWLYGQTYAAGQMAPNSDVVLTSADWIDAVNAGCPVTVDPDFQTRKAAGCEMPLSLWESSASYKDYETFSAGLYALDLFLPLDSLAQQEAWAPSKDRGNWGWWGFYLRFVIQLSGWLIAAVGAAVVTGLVGRRDE